MAYVSANRERNSVVAKLDMERLDATNAPNLKTEVLAAATFDGADRLIIDLGSVTFMDSSGLGALVSIRKNIPQTCEVELRNLNEFVLKVLKLTNMDRVFSF